MSKRKLIRGRDFDYWAFQPVESTTLLGRKTVALSYGKINVESLRLKRPDRDTLRGRWVRVKLVPVFPE